MSVNVEFLTVILPPTPEETYPTGETKVQPKDGESWLPSDSLKTGYAKILIFKAWPLNVTLSFLKRSEKPGCCEAQFPSAVLPVGWRHSRDHAQWELVLLPQGDTDLVSVRLKVKFLMMAMIREIKTSTIHSSQVFIGSK